MPGYTRDGMDVMVDEEYAIITADLKRQTWAASTWAFSWCAMLGLETEALALEKDLRRTGSIDAGHRKDLVDAMQAKRQPTPALNGGVIAIDQRGEGQVESQGRGWRR